jgi:GntR family transcriptional regulator
VAGGPHGGNGRIDLIVEVDTTSPTPPYEQIRAQLARMIGAGVLPAQTRLPSIRQLAADLGLAANTVARAYRELELEGLVTSRVRHGTTVVHPQPTLSRAEISRTLTEAARAYAAVAHQLGIDEETAEAAVRMQLRDARRSSDARSTPIRPCCCLG